MQSWKLRNHVLLIVLSNFLIPYHNDYIGFNATNSLLNEQYSRKQTESCTLVHVQNHTEGAAGLPGIDGVPTAVTWLPADLKTAMALASACLTSAQAAASAAAAMRARSALLDFDAYVAAR